MSIPIFRVKRPGTMTDKERFLRQIESKSVDRCFNMEFGFWEENYQQWKLFKDNGITNNGEASVFFQFDGLGGAWPKPWLNPYFNGEVLEERENTRIVVSGEGNIAEIPKDGHNTIPHYIRSVIETPDDWKKVKEERLRVDDDTRLPNLECVKASCGVDSPCANQIFCGSMIGTIRNLLTFEGLCYAIYDYPEMVEDMVETSCQIVERYLDIILPLGKFDLGFFWEDISYKNGPIVSLDFFNEVVVPRYKRITKKLRQHGVMHTYLDSDGDVRLLIPTFLDCGIDILFPWEVMASDHVGKTLEQYGGALKIMGGVDKTKLIEGKDAIKEHLESLLPYVQKGGYIPFIDHLCPPDVTEENFLYYLDLKEKLFCGC
jgi:hypothetical protein